MIPHSHARELCALTKKRGNVPTVFFFLKSILFMFLTAMNDTITRAISLINPYLLGPMTGREKGDGPKKGTREEGDGKKQAGRWKF